MVEVLSFLLLVLAASGCGDEGEVCVDRDVDGFGEGCEAGPDCDDTNAARTDDCDRVPPPDCTVTPFATGCPCLFGAVTRCFDGPEESIGVGGCEAGTALCIEGHWGLCEGQVAPRAEMCDGSDQDCDGLVDEGVRSPCGACTPGCNGGVWGETDAPFDSSMGTGVALLPGGSLTLARDERLEATTVWVANSGDGTVSRIDALEAVEVARYRTGGSEPSRVAVDYNGDAWVANRELDGGVSTVVKIAGDHSRCVDADGDGLETSSGPTDVLPFGEDECVLFRVPVGDGGDVARALAIDGDRGLDGASGGNPWVGLHDGERVVALDGLTGAVLDEVATPGLQPYAAVFDPWGFLWLASRDGHLVRVNRRASPLETDRVEVPFACFLLYSLAPAADGRLLMTGFSCDDVLEYDPRRGLWRQERTEPSTRGIAIGDGVAWVSHTGGSLSSVDAETLAVADTFDLAGLGITPVESIGVGIDGTGAVWVASSQGGGGGAGVASRFDPAEGVVTAQVPVGRAPHTQGDLSGAELVGGFVEEGRLAYVFEGCPAGTAEGETEWLRVHLDVLPGAAGTVEVAVRHAPSRDALSGAFTVVGSIPDETPPFGLGVPDGGVLEIELRLATSARDGAPVVERLGLEWRCPGPG